MTDKPVRVFVTLTTISGHVDSWYRDFDTYRAADEYIDGEIKAAVDNGGFSLLWDGYVYKGEYDVRFSLHED